MEKTICNNCKRLMLKEKPMLLPDKTFLGGTVAEGGGSKKQPKKAKEVKQIELVENFKPEVDLVDEFEQVLTPVKASKLTVSGLKRYQTANNKHARLLAKKVKVKSDEDKAKIQTEIDDLEKLIDSLKIYENKTEQDIRTK